MKKFRIILWTLGIIIGGAILFYGVVIYRAVFSPYVYNYFHRVEFDSEKWQNWNETIEESSLRWHMIHDLENDYELVGKTRLEIIDLLGKPDYESENEIRYYLGMSGHGIDTGTLILILENDNVIDYDVWRG